jgi:anti-sigma regulatory factor (Ser/Thr protein kinase)
MQAIGADELDVRCLAVRNVAGEFRKRAGYRLAAWRLTGISDDVILVATELITNACAATPETEIRIRLTRERGSVLLGVWDSSDRMPEVRPAGDLGPTELDLSPEHFDDNGGWGLPLVQALATECGVRRTTPNGKWVWARLAAGS